MWAHKPVCHIQVEALDTRCDLPLPLVEVLKKAVVRMELGWSLGP